MEIQFATCERESALEYIQKVYPNRVIEDTQEGISDLLDLVEKDVIRIQDPMIYGNRIGIVPGKNWNESMREKVTSAGKRLRGEIK